jgi:hypothetical protein
MLGAGSGGGGAEPSQNAVAGDRIFQPIGRRLQGGGGRSSSTLGTSLRSHPSLRMKEEKKFGTNFM